MLRRTTTALAAAALLAGGLLATATSASASDPGGGNDWDHIWTTADKAHGGTVYIREHGDVVKLCDTAADGASPRINVDGAYSLTAAGGNGACITRDASWGGVYDLPEGFTVNVFLTLGPNGADEADYSFVNDH
ncbi:hypothetical protein [Streptomyces sp. 8L]|uniref:hypothetical protein n=1 Tax=Streptomyces sp. 8L TaxID=2877242 RepID=UPI001CD28B1A|nr:hypothetical protein [Streptomyces sp. 8L]MCA1222514.1 hypothetical protein [Streptomyces sp. 8L]